MSTLAEMKASIAAEIYRSDMSDTITREIGRAIRFYQDRRFWFNETRTITFSTADGVEFYDASSNVNISDLLGIDYITVQQGNAIHQMAQTTPLDLDTIDQTTASRNVPLWYVYFEQKLRFYPVPNGAYPIRIAGVIVAPAPATDGETGNPWMTVAEELIRSRAKRNIFLHSLSGVDDGRAGMMKQTEDEALMRLQAEFSRRQNIDLIRGPGVY